jgi:hypothetical protein
LSIATVTTDAGQLGEVTARSPFDRISDNQMCGKKVSRYIDVC